MAEQETNQLPAQNGNLSLKQRLSLRGAKALDQRVARIWMAAKAEADATINKLRSDVYSIMDRIAAHDDVAVANSHDLKPSFAQDTRKWVQEGIQLERELYKARIALKTAEKWYARNFPPGEEGIQMPEIEDIPV